MSTSWTEQDDDALLSAIREMKATGDSDEWQVVVDRLGGERSKKACKARYQKLLAKKPELREVLARPKRQPSAGERVIFDKNLRNRIFKNFNPFDLRDLQCMLSLREIKGLMSDEELKEALKAMGEFIDADFVLANWQEMSLQEMREAIKDLLPASMMDPRRMRNKHSIIASYGCLRYVPVQVYAPARLSTQLLRNLEKPAFVRQLRDSGTIQSTMYLSIASSSHLDDVYRRLVNEFGAKPGAMSLECAAACGHLSTIAMIIEEYGVDVNARNMDEDGRTALIVAAVSRRTDALVPLITKYGADLEASNIHKETPLVKAAREGAFKQCQLLLRLGANTEAANSDRATPLFLAAKNGWANVAGVLLEHGAKVDAKNSEGGTPLMVAVQGGRHEDGTRQEGKHDEIVRLLLDHGANVNTRAPPNDVVGNLGGQTALFVACYLGNLEVVEMLLEAGADVQLATNAGLKPINAAILGEGDYEPIMQMLLAAAAMQGAGDEEETVEQMLTELAEWLARP